MFNFLIVGAVDGEWRNLYRIVCLEEFKGGMSYTLMLLF